MSEIISGRYIDYGGNIVNARGRRRKEKDRKNNVEINVTKHYKGSNEEDDSILSASKEEDLSILSSSLSPERGGVMKKDKRHESPFLAFSDLGNSGGVDS